MYSVSGDYSVEDCGRVATQLAAMFSSFGWRFVIALQALMLVNAQRPDCLPARKSYEEITSGMITPGGSSIENIFFAPRPQGKSVV